MKNWKPPNDLTRLLEALGNELGAATDEEVRQACTGSGWSVTGAAREVRGLINAVTGDSSETDEGIPPAEP
jgi:hypothetical protein